MSWKTGIVCNVKGPPITRRVIRRSYVAKTTEQLEHALETVHATAVELRAVEVVGEGSEGSAASQREVERVRAEVWKRHEVMFKHFACW